MVRRISCVMMATRSTRGRRAWAWMAAAAGAMSLASAVAAGQTAQGKPWADYGQLGGCSEEPAKFHKCALEKAKTFNPPRTPDGTPDLRGVWSRARVSSHNVEEHLASFGDPGGVSMVVDPPDGKIPYQPWARAQRDSNHHTYVDPQALCFLPGVGRQAYVPGPYQIFQSPGYVVFIYEYSHAYRVIYTDDRPHVGESIKLSMGHSVGRWEGNALVVDVTNVNAKNWLDDAGNFYSDAARAVERWTLIDNDAIHYEVTFEDPKVYTRSWKMAFGIRRSEDRDFQMMESACYEGNQRTQQGLFSNGLKPYLGIVPPK
ncbi:MAG: hypothetical protein HYY76_16730 [Acidobacteria bacterium]|nr:hypothetical protein [Acidobacteriota bacterium]